LPLSVSDPIPIWPALDRLEPGHCGTVREVRGDGEMSDRLRVMGICEGRKVMLVCGGDPLILRVLGTRIGISARLAAGVRVEVCPDDSGDGDPS